MTPTLHPQADPAPSGPDELLDALRRLLSSAVEQLGLDWGLGWGLFLGLLVPTAVVVVAGAALVVWFWRRTSRSPSHSTGPDQFLGQVVTVDHADGARGQAFVEGSWWTVRNTDAPLQAGQQVRIRAVDRLVLVVEELAANTTSEEEDP